MRRMRGPAKIFCSGMDQHRTLHGFTEIDTDAACICRPPDFTTLTNLLPPPVKHNTGFPLFCVASSDFPRLYRTAM
jgi:hypothetical protein